MSSPLLNHLITAFTCLPTVGPKSAQRMAYYLLERDRKGGEHLSDLLAQAMREIGNCQACRNFSELELCKICSSHKRDRHSLCIVENPQDVTVLEQATNYRGLYYVLMGSLSPIDGIGPQELGMDLLKQRLQNETINELILATNSTVEGAATAFYISEMAAKLNITVTRIAHGVPLGGELEYIDGSTLMHAFSQRKALD